MRAGQLYPHQYLLFATRCCSLAEAPFARKITNILRKICPKGTSFDVYTQYDINRMMSHINSAPRESLGGMTPYALAKLMLPESLLKALNIREVAPDKVCLTPELLKKQPAV